ncbi:hypothetical protein MPSEU_001036800 [Mayamaea pseudoterrestris]|nr:hypothetical protein MPSEU_001036800 [Mayamaea pseudoterrestris]
MLFWVMLQGGSMSDHFKMIADIKDPKVKCKEIEKCIMGLITVFSCSGPIIGQIHHDVKMENMVVRTVQEGQKINVLNKSGKLEPLGVGAAYFQFIDRGFAPHLSRKLYLLRVTTSPVSMKMILVFQFTNSLSCTAGLTPRSSGWHARWWRRVDANWKLIFQTCSKLIDTKNMSLCTLFWMAAK